MALSSALYTGLSGLDVNQAWMSVIGNNIANVNTTAYKSSRALFEPQTYVTEQAGTPPSDDSGGSNPSQLGLGASVATIQKDFTQGSLQTTGNSNDLAINGDGFFVVQNASSGQQFTRDGAFSLNGDHQLVSSNGSFVQGYGVDSDGNVVPGQLQNLTIPLGSATIAKATSNVQIEGNLNASGTVASGGTTITSQDLALAGGGGAPTGTTLLTNLVSAGTGTAAFTNGQTLTLSAQKDESNLSPETYTVTSSSTLGDLQTFFNNSLGIDTSVAGTGAQLVAGTAANSVDLKVVGNSGSANALTMTTGDLVDATGTSPLTFTTSTTNPAAGESTQTSMTVYDSLGVPVNVNVTAVLQSTSDNGTVWKFTATSPDNVDSTNPNSTLVGTGTLTFNTAGQLQTVTGGTLDIHRDGTGADPILPVTLNFSGVSSLAEDAAHSGSDIEMSSQDGIQLGTLTSFSVGTDGTVTGSFDNGQTRALGQVALATFNNPDGLQDDGGNMFSTGADSGVPVISAPQALGAGAIQSGSLEQSNVDISSEFINLITASTGFSAASRVISTSDQLITDLLNSQR